MWHPIEQAMARQVRHLRPIARADADPACQAIADQIERDFGAFVPPFSLHSAAPALLAACWTMLREALVSRHADRLTKEAVASAVSRRNACSYCVDAHTTAMHALGDGVGAGVLADPTRAPAHPGALAPIVAWAAATRTPEATVLRAPPFAADAAPEMIGIALAFHYINRMAQVFLAPSPMPFASPRLKALTRRLLAPRLGGILVRPLMPGASLAWLPEAPLPADFVWARRNPEVAAAFARAAATFEAAGAALLPPAVRALVAARLRAWQGEDADLDRRWLDDVVATVAAGEQAAARLALLAAFAPFRVDDAVIADFRRAHPGDAALITAVAWASFAAARRIGGWLVVAQCSDTAASLK